MSHSLSFCLCDYSPTTAPLLRQLAVVHSNSHGCVCFLSTQPAKGKKSTCKRRSILMSVFWTKLRAPLSIKAVYPSSCWPLVEQVVTATLAHGCYHAGDEVLSPNGSARGHLANLHEAARVSSGTRSCALGESPPPDPGCSGPRRRSLASCHVQEVVETDALDWPRRENTTRGGFNTFKGWIVCVFFLLPR